MRLLMAQPPKMKITCQVSGRLTFRPGETVKAISIAILDDNAAEKKETIIVELKNTSFGTLRDSQAFVYITDDDS